MLVLSRQQHSSALQYRHVDADLLSRSVFGWLRDLTRLPNPHVWGWRSIGPVKHIHIHGYPGSHPGTLEGRREGSAHGSDGRSEGINYVWHERLDFSQPLLLCYVVAEPLLASCFFFLLKNYRDNIVPSFSSSANSLAT